MNNPSRVEGLPPHSLEAEQATIGCYLLQAESIDASLQSGVQGEWFYDLRYRDLHTALAEMWNKGEVVDLVTVGNKLKQTGQLEEIGGLSHLAELMDAVPSAANLSYYTEILKDKFIRRRLNAALLDARQAIFTSEEGADAILAKTESVIDSCRVAGGTTESMTSKQVVREMVDELQERYAKSISNHGITGIATGFKRMDGKTCGLQAGELTIVCARPGVGKSVFLLNIAQSVGVEQDIPCLFLTAEMTPRALIQRIACNLANVDAINVRNASICATGNEPLQRKFLSACSRVSKSKILWKDVRRQTVSQLGAIIRSHVRKHGIKAVFVDYLQLIKADSKGEKRTYDLGEVAEALKDFAVANNIPVIAACQLNRDNEKRGGRPKLSDIADSKQIEQAGELIILLYRDDETPEKAEVIIAKQRSGPTGIMPMLFEGKYLRFSEEMPRVDQGAQ